DRSVQEVSTLRRYDDPEAVAERINAAADSGEHSLEGQVLRAGGVELAQEDLRLAGRAAAVRARIAGVADAVVVRIGLARVRHRTAVVAEIADAIPVGVLEGRGRTLSVPVAELRRVARVLRRPALGRRGLDRVRGAVVAYPVAAVRDVAEARLGATERRALRV